MTNEAQASHCAAGEWRTDDFEEHADKGTPEKPGYALRGWGIGPPELWRYQHTGGVWLNGRHEDISEYNGPSKRWAQVNL